MYFRATPESTHEGDEINDLFSFLKYIVFIFY